MPYLKLFALILALSLSAVSQAAADEVPSAASVTDAAAAVRKGGGSEERAKLALELQSIRQELPGKKQELARLYRKWLAVKGRIPSEEERKAFEEKVSQGEVTFEDNPFVNKNPLSNPTPARMAYYKKLQEVKGDEERIRQLERELAR